MIFKLKFKISTRRYYTLYMWLPVVTYHTHVYTHMVVITMPYSSLCQQLCDIVCKTISNQNIGHIKIRPSVDRWSSEQSQIQNQTYFSVFWNAMTNRESLNFEMKISIWKTMKVILSKYTFLKQLPVFNLLTF